MEIVLNDLQLITRALSTNSAVLFLGAGFSRDAENKLGQHVPMAQELAASLWSLLGYDKPYDGTDLPTVFQATLKRLKHDQIRNLLNDSFTCTKIPHWCYLLFQFWWYRIYTTNIDDLVENVYRDSNATQRLDTINGIAEDYRDRDQFLDSIQYVKLNGTLEKAPLGITFSIRQYAARAGAPDTWYDQFARDYSTRVTIFVGSQLREPLLWSAVEARGRKYRDGENRPRSFVVCPEISPALVDALKEYNVVGIQGTGQEFLEVVAKQHSPLSKEQVLLRTSPALEGMFKILAGHISTSHARHLRKFYASFKPVSVPDKVAPVRKLFLLGAEPQWSDIYSNLDAPRQCNQDLQDAIEASLTSGKVTLFAVTGSAGSGKSTTLKRTLLNLSAKGHPVFLTSSEELPAVHEFEGAIELLQHPTVVAFDNAALAVGLLPDYLHAAKRCKVKHTFVVAERTNRLIEKIPYLKDLVEVVDCHMPDLSSGDIDNLIDVLEKHQLLGELANKNRLQQQQQFAIYAHRQILVAMRSATLGKGFDEIIKGEFVGTTPPEAALLYLCVCLATDAEFSLSKQQLVASSQTDPAETLAFLVTTLRDLVIPVFGNLERYTARHRVIAELIIQSFAPREMLKLAYVSLLRTLSHDLSFPPQHSAAFRLYRKLINHSTIYQRFTSDLDRARSIYDAISPHFQRDYHFWLQYGSLELEYGELDTAANYLSQAYSYAPDDDFVMTTRAQLFFKQARVAMTLEIAQQLRKQAIQILEAQFRDRPKDDYPVHIYCSQELAWINRWYMTNAEKRVPLEDLREFAMKAAKNHARARRVQEIAKVIADAYLDLATPR